MRIARLLPSMLLLLLAVLHGAWSSAEASAVAAGLDYGAAKGFVTARTSASLTVLAGDRRILVVITRNTRVVGQRDSVAEIVPNDVVRAEGRRVTGSGLLAERIEVAFATDRVKVRPLPAGPTIDLITFTI